MQPPDPLWATVGSADLGDRLLTLATPILPPPPSPRGHLVTRAATPEQIQEAVRQLQLDLLETRAQIGHLQQRLHDLERLTPLWLQHLEVWLLARWHGWRRRGR